MYRRSRRSPEGSRRCCTGKLRSERGLPRSRREKRAGDVGDRKEIAMPTLSARLVGGPTAILEYAGLRWLTDPSLSPPGTYAGDLVKTTGPAVEPDAIGPIDVVLLSHEHHSDNLD